MTWEWVYSSPQKRWTLTVGDWHAVVERVDGPQYLWHAYIERAAAPRERYDGPTRKDAVDGRTWCLSKIAQLRTDREAL